MIRGAFDVAAATDPTAHGPEAFEAPARHGPLQGGGRGERPSWRTWRAPTTARVSGVDEEEAPQGSSRRRPSTPPRSWPPRPPRASRPARTHAHRREPLHGRLHLLPPRGQHGVPGLARPRRDGERHLRRTPPTRPTARSCWPKGELKATRGKKETTDHPPIYPTAKPPRPTTSPPADYKLYNLIARRFLATLSEARPSVEGTKVIARRERRAVRGQGRRAGRAGLPRHLPLRPEERRAAARARRGRHHRLQRRRLHEEADRAARALHPGQARPGDGEAGASARSPPAHSIIERLYASEVRRRTTPSSPAQLGIAVVRRAGQVRAAHHPPGDDRRA